VKFDSSNQNKQKRFVFVAFLWNFCLKEGGRNAGSGRKSKVSLARILRSAIHEIPVEKCAILLRFSYVFLVWKLVDEMPSIWAWTGLCAAAEARKKTAKDNTTLNSCNLDEKSHKIATEIGETG
jgi:hypothetical protein